ncbi:MAG: C4-dicarboxylate ABC transporter substrate-binding protein [Pseudomonadota bacterium]
MFRYLFASTLAIGLCGQAIAVEWNVSLWGERRAFTEHVEKLAELVSQKTAGEFELNLDYGGLANNRENLDGIAAGAFEMAQFCAGYHPEKNPTLSVLELPFLGVQTLEQEIAVSQAVYSHPAVVADMARWNATLLMPSPLPQYNLIGVGPAPDSLYALRESNVRATGGIADAMRVLEANPVAIPATEVREALDNETIRAVAFAPHAHLSFDTLEGADWWTENLNPGTVNCPVVVNNGALEALSPDHRAALLSSVDEALDHYLNYYDSVTMQRWEPSLQAAGVEKVSFNPVALEVLRDASVESAVSAWVMRNMVLGVPARDLLEFVRTAVRETAPAQ